MGFESNKKRNRGTPKKKGGHISEKRKEKKKNTEKREIKKGKCILTKEMNMLDN